MAVALLQLSNSATAQTPPTASKQDALRSYRINPGDDIEVYVWGEERLQRQIRVLPDGTFSFPLVGQVQAANKLPAEIEAIVSKGLEAQYRGQVPQVTVSVKSANGLQFSVVGKVRSPGSFTPGRYVNVLEALTLAGGPAEFADVGNVVILRKQNDKIVPIRVRLTDALKGSPNQRDESGGLPQIEGGDTVVVP
jgi:polysaccharide export outer membrane protein